MSMSPTAPGAQSAQLLSYVASPASVSHSQSFKRPASSDDEGEHGDHGDHGRGSISRRNTVVKREGETFSQCAPRTLTHNASLQLKCNVQQDPFKSCDRCIKQRLRCLIEPNFKRVGKRNRNAEMEREMEQLRERLAMYEGRQPVTPGQSARGMQGVQGNGHGYSAGEEDDSYLHTQHQQVAATSLLDLRSGSPMYLSLGAGNSEVRLPASQVQELFGHFFAHYHPFLPFLDPSRSPEDVYTKDSKLLFWAIIAVAARRYDADRDLLVRLKEPLTDEIWRAIKNHPNHHVVKALCLLCTWPLPARTTTTDPTFMLCGVMMQIAMQNGLHQPMHPQDFQRKKVRLQEQDIHDRLRTWAACNIVAQTVSTGNGQPSITLYDSTLEFKSDDADHLKIIPPGLLVRLRQEMGASRINKLLYASSSKRFTGQVAMTYMNLEQDRLEEESGSLDGVDKTIEQVHLRATILHLRLFAFFNPEPRIDRRDDLVALYSTATLFLDSIFALQKTDRLKYVPFYLMQMSLAAGFALLKLLNSDFGYKLPFDEGRIYVLQTIDALRKSKVKPNDLCDRLAEVLAQLWKASSRGRSVYSTSQSPVIGNPNVTLFNTGQRRESNALEDPLGLIMRSRMSMSVVFDCVWRWRESQIPGASETLDSTVVNNPTNPDGSHSPPPNATPNDIANGTGSVGGAAQGMGSGAMIENPAHTMPGFNPHLNTLSMPLQLTNGMASANSFEVFDSVNWLLENQEEWPGYGGFGGFGA
ncbi:hypothetical protein M011DRAFT_515679 [Sporormia fimetaria CBS 119925]|uniref:Xylanolytic transcriptional activator regulatory domain-containing protein n=1 Tax=Sporormia fimetaria CBS 119925 TaxID=1340428 RepID=A0A6A6VGN8_9PLEO|nr:hypothetical protein M011DRAFT_515679 [Sporormia fimetaria CBS 119925]